MDGRCAKVVGTLLHGKAVNANLRVIYTQPPKLVYAGQHLPRNKVLPGAVCLYDCGNKVLGNILVVRQKLFGVFGQTIPAVAKARIVVMVANARIQAHSLDYLSRIKFAHLRIRVQLIEICNAKGQISVGEKLYCLRFGSAAQQQGNASCSVCVFAILFLFGSALQQKLRELACGTPRFFIGGGANHNARRVQVVVKGLALAQEFGGEDYALIAQTLAQLFGIPNRNGGLDNDPCFLVHGTDGLNGGLHARGIEEIHLGVVICGRGDYCEIDVFVSLAFIQRCCKVQFAVAGGMPVQKLLDFLIGDGAFALVEQGDFFGHHIKGSHLVVLRQQHCQRKAHISHSCYGYLH